MGEICIFENELQNVAYNIYHICENSHKLMVLDWTHGFAHFILQITLLCSNTYTKLGGYSLLEICV